MKIWILLLFASVCAAQTVKPAIPPQEPVSVKQKFPEIVAPKFTPDFCDKRVGPASCWECPVRYYLNRTDHKCHYSYQEVSSMDVEHPQVVKPLSPPQFTGELKISSEPIDPCASQQGTMGADGKCHLEVQIWPKDWTCDFSPTTGTLRCTWEPAK